ncbi:MAG: hypothetical protein E4H02_12205 [Lentisphaerales bacterium]|nr:MAG: hypothetical protein E4H02_12205 [Lentisphaerales bacterium]
MNQEEVRRRGIDILQRELGAQGMLRFLQQFDRGNGDYSNARHDLLDNLTVDEVMKAIDSAKKQ